MERIKRLQVMEKARTKRSRKKVKEEEPVGIVAKVAHLGQDAAQSVGDAVKSATAAITGTKKAPTPRVER